MYWVNRRSTVHPIHTEICRRLVTSVPWGPPGDYAKSQKSDPNWWAGPFDTIEEAKAAHPQAGRVCDIWDDDTKGYVDGWLCECVTENTPGDHYSEREKWEAFDNHDKYLDELKELRGSL